MNRIKKVILGFLSVFLIVTLNLKAENSFILWKINKGNATVYLAPTIHYLTEDFYPLNPKVDKIMEESDYLVVELDVHSDKNFQIISADGMKYLLNKDKKMLKELLTEEKYKELNEKMMNLGLDLKKIEMLNPGTLSALVVEMNLTGAGYNSQLGLDNQFLIKAKILNKPILELETPLYQLEKLFSLDFDLQMEILLEILGENGKKDTIEMINTFRDTVKSGDLEGFEKKFIESTTTDEKLKEYYKNILDERNVGMANKIEGYIKKGGTYFIAVGGGHYVGVNNIRELLEKKGYKIERVKF